MLTERFLFRCSCILFIINGIHKDRAPHNVGGFFHTDSTRSTIMHSNHHHHHQNHHHQNPRGSCFPRGGLVSRTRPDRRSCTLIIIIIRIIIIRIHEDRASHEGVSSRGLDQIDDLLMQQPSFLLAQF
jgi:hypothetical protein